MSHGGPPLYRCAGCGCPVLDHAVDDEERRECTVCECRQYLGVAHRHADAWPLNLAANLAAAGMAAVLHRLLVRSCMNGDCDCSSGRMQRTMREAVS